MIEISGELKPHSYAGHCASCGAWTRLKSYGAKKILKVGLPIKTVGHVHVADRCSVCGSARALDQAEWDAHVQQARDEAGRAGEVGDPSTAADLLFTLSDLNDRDLFMPVAHDFAARFASSLEVQKALLYAYDRFDMSVAAERAAQALVALEDNAENRRALARVYLRQGDPAQAAQQLAGQEHTPEGASHMLLVAELHGSLGQVAQAEEVLALLDQTDPDVPTVRAMAQRHAPSPTLLPLRYLPSPEARRPYENAKSAASPGCLWAVVLGLAVPFFGIIALAIAFGTEEVDFINGTAAPYAVQIDGEEHTLPPGRTVVNLKSGEHEMTAFAGTDRMLQMPIVVEMTTTERRMIVNPDRAAILQYEEADFKERPTTSDHYVNRYMAGNLVYNVEVDHAFKAFPVEVTIIDGEAQRHTRVGLYTGALYGAMNVVANDKEFGNATVLQAMRARLLANPDDNEAMIELTARTPPDGTDELRGFLALHLDDKPARVAWHRAFLRTGFPAADIYRERFAGQEIEDACVAGMVASVTSDVDKRDALLRQAVSVDQPCSIALHEAAFYAARAGDVREAKRLAARLDRTDADEKGTRERVFLLLGQGKKAVDDYGKMFGEPARNGMSQHVDWIEGRKRSALRKANSFLRTAARTDLPADVAPGYKSWTSFVQESIVFGTADRAALAERAATQSDVKFALDLNEDRLADAALSLTDGTIEAHLLVAAHALRNKDKDLAEAQVALAKSKWTQPGASILDDKKPSLREARTAAAGLSTPRALFAYLGMANKKSRRTMFKEADRLMVDRAWSALAIRGLPYRWRQGAIK